MKRRNFNRATTTIFLGSAFLPLNKMSARKFKLCLNPGAIGVSSDLSTTLDLAARYGFESISGNVYELAKMTDGQILAFNERMNEINVSWGAGGLPVQFRQSDSIFREDLLKLPPFARSAQRAGLQGLSTWIMPTSEELTYRENYHLHAKRLKDVAKILGYHGQRLGLEYVGPKTLMSRDRYPFISSMKETKELIEAIDEPNVGIVLDSFHWFCANESPSDILTLDKNDIITCDLNDAKEGRTYRQQIDGERELPAKTGIIDLKAFLSALIQIGYEGPVRAEPFNKELNAMDNEPAVKSTSEAMKMAFGLVG